MGLDMYLSAKRYISPYEHGINKDDRTLGEKIGSLIGITPLASDDETFRVEGVTIRVGYWRKANHIHRWFVENCQKGVDDCGDYYVSREQLEALRDLCNQVLETSALVPGEVVTGYTFKKSGDKIPIKEPGKVIINPHKAEELLPTQGGFFFGGTDYDESYISDLQETVEIINRALELDEHLWTFEYHSSW